VTAVRIAIIGGGSAYIPGLVRGFIVARDGLADSTLALMDVNAESLALMSTLARKMVAAAGADYRVEATTDRRAAIAGADFVLTTFRPGGLEARRLDERIPLEHGLIGQETIGPGGLFMAFRSIPVMLAIAREVEELAPEAWIVNYTNPTQMVTEAVLRHSGARIIGLCDQHAGDLAAVGAWAGIDPHRFRPDWYGLNHATWTTRLVVDGRDVLPELHARLCEMPDDQLPGGPTRYAFRLFRQFGALPNTYLRYYYFHDELVHQARQAPMTRAEEILSHLPAILDNYRREAAKDRPDPTRERGGGDHGEYAVEVINAIANDRPARFIVNGPNQGAIADFGPDDVVEVSAVVSRDGARPLAMGALPPAVAGLIHALRAYEKLAVEAAVTGSREAALRALLAHPLVRDWETAEGLLDEMLEAHREWLPQFRWEKRRTTSDQ
jgi:6-phospho-beta-glucosidase